MFPSYTLNLFSSSLFDQYQGFDFSDSFSWGLIADAALLFISRVISTVSIFIFAMIVGFFVGKAAYKKWNSRNGTKGKFYLTTRYSLFET